MCILLSVMLVSISGCGNEAVVNDATLVEQEVAENVTEEVTTEITEEIKDTDEEIQSVDETDDVGEDENSNETKNAETEVVIPTTTPKETTAPKEEVTVTPTETPTVTPTPVVVEPTPEPEPTVSAVSYSPSNVVSLATAKTKAAGKTLLSDLMNESLASGGISQEEYNQFYPYAGAGYYSVFVEIDLNQASTTSGRRLESEDGIATYISGMLALESGPYFLIEYAGIYTSNTGAQFYEFRCYRA